MKEQEYKVISHDIPLRFAEILSPKDKMTFIYVSGAGNYNHTDQMWRYKGQKHIQKMQYVYWALSSRS